MQSTHRATLKAAAVAVGAIGFVGSMVVVSAPEFFKVVESIGC